MSVPFAFKQAGNDHVVISEAFTDIALHDKAELLEKLASRPISLRGQRGDSLAPKLIEWVLKDRPSEVRRQPVAPISGKTNLYVAEVRLMIRKNHPRNEIVVLIDYADSLARSPLNVSPYSLSNPLSDKRAERAGD